MHADPIARASAVMAFGPVWQRTGRMSWQVKVATRDILAGRWDRTVEVQAAPIALREGEAGCKPAFSPNSEAPMDASIGLSMRDALAELSPTALPTSTGG